MSQKLYQEFLMDHYRSPRNFGSISSPDFFATDHNPSCGDRVSFCGRIDGDKIKEIKFEGSGCVLSVASSSIISEKVENKALDAVLKISKQELFDELGIMLGPNRVKCVLLGLYVLQEGVQRYLGKKVER